MRRETRSGTRSPGGPRSCAGFSRSAENTIVEFGVLIDNCNLTEAAEDDPCKAEGLLFEAV